MVSLSQTYLFLYNVFLRLIQLALQSFGMTHETSLRKLVKAILLCSIHKILKHVNFILQLYDLLLV